VGGAPGNPIPAFLKLAATLLFGLHARWSSFGLRLDCDDAPPNLSDTTRLRPQPLAVLAALLHFTPFRVARAAFGTRHAL